MRIAFLIVPAVLLAGCAAPKAAAPNPGTADAKVPVVEYRSAFDGYRRFAEQEPIEWRKANEEVGSAAGHRGHK